MKKKVIFICILALLSALIIIVGSSYHNKTRKVILAEESTEYQEYESKRQKIRLEEKAKELIVLPSTIYVLEDGKEKNIYNRSIIKGDLSKNKVSIESEFIEPFDGGFKIKSIKENDAKKRKLTISVQEEQSVESLNLTTDIESVPIENEDNINLLSIGDSMTRTNSYSNKSQELLPNVSTVGTRTYDDGISNGEGRGGWSITDYLTRIGSENGVDSPFLFPEEIEADHYLGNTEFWKQVTFENPNGYEYEGFQKIAKGWNGENYIFNKEGYPINSEVGDVMIDPNLEENKRFVQYDGSEWKTMSPQPKTKFNFSSYIERYGDAFENKNPNYVSILLGANDYEKTPNLNETYFANSVETIIESVHEYDSNIAFIVNLPVVGNNQEVFEGAELYRSNMQQLGIQLIKRFEGRESERIYLSTTNAVVDERHIVDNIHPNEEGYSLMGESLAATLQNIRNKN